MATRSPVSRLRSLGNRKQSPEGMAGKRGAPYWRLPLRPEVA
jgi:hypothetical protein